MAFTAATFSRIAHAAGNNVFYYQSADAIGTVDDSGYFNSVYNELFQGDVILAVTSVGGTIAITVMVVTSASGAATVTTALHA